MASRQKHQIWLIITAVAAVLTVAIILFRPEPDAEPQNPLAGAPRSTPNETANTDSTTTDPTAITEITTAPLDDPAANTANRTPLRPAVVPFAGRVTDAETGRPITSFIVLLEKVTSKSMDDVIHEKVDDAEGRFAFTVEPWDRYKLTVHSWNHIPRDGQAVKVPPETGVDDLHIALDPGLTITGSVVDDETGLPLRGATAGAVRFNNLYNALPSGFTEGSNYTTTDEEGRFTVGGVKTDPRFGMRDHVLAGASHPDYATASQWIKPAECGPLEFRLKKGFRAFGQVRDDAARPAKGISVYLVERKSVLRPVALTDDDGRYRTRPAKPGKITLRACDNSYRYGNPVRFTTEEKEIDVVDRDVPVDFGPTAEQVTWSGTLFGIDGAPLAETSIELTRARAPTRGPAAKTLGRARTDGAGRFEFRKLPLGEYCAGVYLPDERRTVAAGDFAFDEPGAAERDILLTCTGGTVSGAVIDGTTNRPATGLPALLPGSAVRAYPVDENMDRATALVNEADATFCFTALPAGIYSLYYPFADPLHRVEVTDGSRISGLQLIVRPTGDLHLRMEGFSDEERKELDVSVCTGPGPDRTIAWPGRDKSDHLIHRLGLGDYVLRYGSETMGAGLARFAITHGCTTVVTITRSEILPPAVDLEVRGLVTLPGGAPAASAELLFQHTNRSSRGRTRRTTTCDAEGAYAVEDLFTGLWKISCIVAGGLTYRFGNVMIPPGAESPYALDLVAPAGRVCGTLIDSATGGLVDTGDVGWLVRVAAAGGGLWPADLRRAGKGEFDLRGIPGGRYYVSGWVPGYRPLRSGFFELRDGETVDLGNLLLEPSGYLDLEVVDGSGAPVDNPTTYCNGKHLARIVEDNRVIAPNRRLFFSLPTGKVLIRVEPSRCEPAEKEVVLEPGVRTRVRMVVIRREND